MSGRQVVVVGGGLAGLSAAHTILERGGRVVVIDKNPFLGGNSVKATSGINAALTTTQISKGIQDSVDSFYQDTAKSARELLRPDIVKVLVGESAPAVEWLMKRFNLDLSLVSRLGGHSHPRTHRGKERFPGMTITYALMEELERIASQEPKRARVYSNAKVVKLVSTSGEITGVEYEKDGKRFTEMGPVVIATGGYGADFSDHSLLVKHRPDIASKGLATTNGSHCTGDGIKMASEMGANCVDMTCVQVHPTGLVDPAEPEAKVKFLAAEALRGVGGLLLDANGNRFCDELGHRDYVTGEMWKNKGPFRLILNSAAAREIEWHCKHYCGRGLMIHYPTGRDVAKAMGISAAQLSKTFQTYNQVAKSKSCPYGKKFFHNLPLSIDDNFHVAVVTPVVHYTMGGLQISPAAEIVSQAGPIPGLFAAGEVCGGVHGVNRLGGSSLLDCVVFGRVAGASVSSFLFSKVLDGSTGGDGFSAKVNVSPAGNKVTMELSWQGGPTSSTSEEAVSAAASTAAASDANTAATGAASPSKTWSWAEVKKHNKKDDCWVVVAGKVLDVTGFLKDHPGGAKAILMYAGRDATAEFDMLHKPDVIEKYAPEVIIGVVEGDEPKARL